MPCASSLLTHPREGDISRPDPKPAKPATKPAKLVSDEFDGITQDNDGNVRPLIPRSFSSLSQAEEENGQSRIYLGIHWPFDKTEGIAQGWRVADYVFKNAFKPLR